MLRFALSLTPTLAWLVATAMAAWLVRTILSVPENIGLPEIIFLLVSVIGTCLCLFASYREAVHAYNSYNNGTSYWNPKQPESNSIGAKAGNRYPMTEAQISRVKTLLAAFSTAGLISDGLDIGLIGEMENEGYGDDIGAYETLLSLRNIFIEHDMEFHSMVFTDEHIETNEEKIKQLVQEILTLVGESASINDINVNWPAYPQTEGSVNITLNDGEHSIACQFHSKNTPSGLIEGIAGLIHNNTEQSSQRLYWENLDSTLVLAKLTPQAAQSFNAEMEICNENFRFEPVESGV